ncbi:hypothetical protein Lfu02_08040 [Longispora fulva]|uniref:MFS family permease n=1 Tax=Longispora fulva TaxID=619741 RepID=A0A8J7KET0_9ACTN|nr:MFS transporter [Longispora fulva]MBG6135330.1 MFS family permease [Longispora fulva]GIG56432.1 hypothetical protein Lfu02_08040 [Longispora fulva]
MNSSYWRLWTATVVSRLGDSVRQPALGLLAAALTRDPVAFAVVAIAGQLPWLLVGLFAGALADRWDRRRTMAAVDGLRMLLVLAFAGLVLADRVTIAALAGFAFLLTALGTLFDAAATAVLPAIVPAARLPTANGRMAVGITVIGGFVGTPLGAVLYAVAAALPFAVDAVTFAVAALLALTLPSARPPAADRPGLFAEARLGLRWLAAHPTLRALTGLTAGANLVVGALLAVLVLLALEHLHVPARGFGLFFAVASLGAALGGLLAGRVGRLLGTLPALAVVLVAQTAALVALAVLRAPAPGAVALGLFTAGGALWNVLVMSYSQGEVPSGLLGRVGTAQRMAGVASAPVGAALGGALAAWLGLTGLLLCCAAAMALVAVATVVLAGRSRRAEFRPRPVLPAGTTGR